MNHPMHRVVSFAIVGPHELEVGFEDGVVRRINFLPVLEGELFGPLKDLSVFNQVAAKRSDSNQLPRRSAS